VRDGFVEEDLAIHTAPPGRSRVIDRYARSAQLPPGSDEALMLEAMPPPTCSAAPMSGWSTSDSGPRWRRER
jgi:hypothetical protein